MEQIYTEKEILGDALTAEKTSTSNYNTYSNECVHENLRDVMLTILKQEHDIQDDVFKMMHARGLYPTPAADEKKIQETKTKYACSMKQKEVHQLIYGALFGYNGSGNAVTKGMEKR